MYLIYFKTPIDESFDGIQFTIGNSNFTNVKVSIEGYYMKNIFRQDYTKLQIIINDLVFPNSEVYKNIIPYNIYKLGKEIDSGSFVPTEYSENPVMERKSIEMWDLSIQNLGPSHIECESIGFGRIYLNESDEIIAIAINDDSSWSLEIGNEIIIPGSVTKETLDNLHRELGWNIEDWYYSDEK